MPDCKLLVQVLFGQLTDLGMQELVPRTRGGQLCQTYLQVELKWYKLAQDRPAWRQVIATVHT